MLPPAGCGPLIAVVVPQTWGKSALINRLVRQKVVWIQRPPAG